MKEPYPYPSQGQGEEAFRTRFKERYGKEAAPSAAYAYDSVMLVAEALKAGKKTPDEIVAFLREVEYVGLTNTIAFDENGRITEKPHVMKAIENGKFVTV